MRVHWTVMKGYTPPTDLPDYPPHTAVDVPQVSDDAVVPSVQESSLNFTGAVEAMLLFCCMTQPVGILEIQWIWF